LRRGRRRSFANAEATSTTFPREPRAPRLYVQAAAIFIHICPDVGPLLLGLLHELRLLRLFPERGLMTIELRRLAPARSSHLEIISLPS
jgi:hypothetical protein